MKKYPSGAHPGDKSSEEPKQDAKKSTEVPAIPSGVPSSAKYSPSQGKWWWQENGQWKSN